jgi:T-complex protein 1 subunit delta
MIKWTNKLVDGIILDQKTIGFGALTRIEKAKIGLIQFCISPPKTDLLVIMHKWIV